MACVGAFALACVVGGLREGRYALAVLRAVIVGCGTLSGAEGEPAVGRAGELVGAAHNEPGRGALINE